jgi:hypothetical protein
MSVIKVIGNNKEREIKSQHGDTREVKTMGASQENFTISRVCFTNAVGYLMMR